MLTIPSPDYRADIDGLRAIAVLSVIVYHADAAFLPGGLLGVDVFFVISGFLITGIIAREITAGSFSFSAFFERRIRRLFPAFCVVALASLVVGWFTLLPSEYKELGVGLAGASTATANILFFLKVDYFAPAAELNPMLHTWSLAVEEQFYLILPLFLLLLARWRVPALWLILGIGAIFGFLLAWFTASTNPTAAFYLLPFRAWELLFGGMLAVLPIHLKPNSARVVGLAGLLGLTGVCASMVLHLETLLHPGPITLLPVLATGLLLWAGGAGPAARMLSLRPLVFLGVMSYSLYLWHQPVFAIARKASLVPIELPHLLALALLIGVLSYVTLIWIERPFRTGVPGRRFAFFRGYVALSMALFVSGAGLHVSRGVPARTGGQIALIEAMADNYDVTARSCSSPLNAQRSARDACLHGAETARKVAVWGDSHGVQLAAILPQVDPGFAVKQYTASGCPPLQGFFVFTPTDGCADFQAEVLQEILADTDLDTVVLIMRGGGALKGGFDNGVGGVEIRPYTTPPLNSMTELNLSESERRARVLDAFRDTVATLLDAGKTVLVIDPIPEQGWNVPQRMARVLQVFGPDAVTAIAVPLSGYHERQREFIGMLDSLPSHPRLHRLRTAEVLCDQEACPATTSDGVALYYDDDHLTNVGTVPLAQAVAQVLSRIEVAKLH